MSESGKKKQQPRQASVTLHTLRPAAGATHKRKRLGRGPGSGHGKTAGRGNKGFWSRSGSSQKRGFEGGQMPLHRRVPKRGFTNIFRKEFAEVNVDVLASRFAAGATVGPDELEAARVVRKRLDGIKVLGRGEITHALTVRAHRFSAEARRKIEAAGGKVETL
jgi:large subunit ribosomal protein L15